MEKQFLIGIPYRQKINFDIFIKYDKFENNAFITFVSKGIIEYPTLQKEIFVLLEEDQKLLISITKEQYNQLSKEYQDDENIVFLIEHPKNFHSLFNTYIYYHTGYNDPHPRLFHECVFYGKKIIYINDKNIKDGGYYRYYDAINNGIKNHKMRKDDEIVKNMIEGIV